jgi:hypothetical protein
MFFAPLDVFDAMPPLMPPLTPRHAADIFIFAIRFRCRFLSFHASAALRWFCGTLRAAMPMSATPERPPTPLLILQADFSDATPLFSSIFHYFCFRQPLAESAAG